MSATARRFAWRACLGALLLAPALPARAATTLPDAGPAAVVGRGYGLLLRTSIVAPDPRRVAAAAIGAIDAPGPAPALPAGFGDDVERDGAWLGARAPDLASAWRMLNAMARSSGIAHVGLTSPESRRGAAALFSGRPPCAPGFAVHRLADGRFVVSEVIAGASADRAGLRVGDVLLRLGDERLERQTALLLPVLVLPAGTTIVLGIERDGRPRSLVLKLVQADVSSVDSRMLADDLAYVRLRWFARSDDPARDTAALARGAFEELSRRGARGLVLDLRSALGGIGDVGIASALADGDVVYFVQQPLSHPPEPVPRRGTRIWPARPIVVLVNEQTISAGEALALALRELAGAPVVGQASAGGLTEGEFIPLGDGHALMIPTGVVLGPVSRQDQPGHAVVPDRAVSDPTIDELRSGRDRQLDAARDLLLAH